MREFNECKAEIFRRIDNGIKERKRRRNHILMCCVPLCLCLVIWSIAILPAMLPANKGNDYAPEAGNGETEATAYARVEIMDKRDFPNEYCDIEDAETVDQIYTLIEGVFYPESDPDIEEDFSPTAPDSDNNPDVEDIPPTMEKDEYYIAFSYADKKDVVYLITKNEIINQTTNERKTLTEAEYETLMESIGALVTWEEVSE